MGADRRRTAFAIVVAFVCVAVLGSTGIHPAAAAPSSFRPPGDAQPPHSHRAVVGRAQATRPPRGLATRGNAVAPAVPSGTWQPVGPSPIAGSVQDPSQSGGQYGDVSGRVTALVTDPTNPATVYAGGADGGVWKSTNGGGGWTPLTDSQPTLAVGSLAIDSTGQIIYAGTGEANGSQDSQYGDGVLKSINGGTSWTLMGSSTLAGLHIGSIAIDSQVSNAQRVLAATDAGLYISTDGGSTWNRNTNIDSVIIHLAAFDHSIFEIHQDPTIPARFFATVGDFCNNEQGQVLVSPDSGATWSNSDSLSVSTDCSQRISLGAGPGNTEYAAWSDINGDLKYIRKSTNGGASWSTVMNGSTTSYLDVAGSPQAWYDNVVAVDPTNPNRAVFGGVTVINTTNGGASYTDVGHVYDPSAGLHPDFHAIAFTGANTLYIGNDGGVWHSTTLGGTTGPSWTDVNSNLNITQFYNGSALNVGTLIGGAQDVGDPGRLPTTPPAPRWQQYGEGDGTGTAIVPGSNGNSVYLSVPGAGILRQTSALSGGIEANPTIAAPCNFGVNPAQGTACADPAAFVAPFVMDPNNGNKLFAATNHVYRSTSGGLPAGNGGWSQISPNLTSGTAFTGTSDFITAMAMIPGTNTVVTGAGLSGTVFETTNGSTWTNVSGNLPNATSTNFRFEGSIGWITGVAINPANSSELWVTIGDSTGTGTVWHTTTAGGANSWADLSSVGTAPITGPVNSIVQDPATPTTLYVGTALGVYTCTGCGGASPTPSWSTAGSGMPNVSVDSVTISSDQSTLVAWTHGRGAWELALNQPIRTMSTSQYTLNGSDGTTWQTMDPANLSITFTPATTGREVLTGNADLWTWNTGFNQDIGIMVNGSLIAWKESGGFAGTFSPNAAAVQGELPVTAGTTYTAQLVWKANTAIPSGDRISAGAGSPGNFSPTTLQAELEPPIGSGFEQVTSPNQYTLSSSDGVTFQPIDSGLLQFPFTPSADSNVILTGNVDLWTYNAGFNQDVGINVSPACNGQASTLAAWKESGGFAGNFSPNAAFVQADCHMTGGTPYTVSLVWKSNKNLSGAKIAAGAGSPGNFSPTDLYAVVNPLSGGPQIASSTNQYNLASSNGVTWTPVDASLSLPISPGSTCVARITANADLWTWNAGVNQDIGIEVDGSVVAWKESGGFAGTFSPNAAFVQGASLVSAGPHTVTLVWKTNIASPGKQISMGAGPPPAPFSPTTLAVELLC
ncbi:MAG: hypothetical protein JOZ75_03390 [Candidatus Dormibacteraeota bacterium]|nr:hypothetical protein [Candidatus Dormibacteraeota bacterium]